MIVDNGIAWSELKEVFNGVAWLELEEVAWSELE